MNDARAIAATLACFVLLLTFGCGGSGSKTNTNTNTIVTSGSNVQPITVGSGPTGNYTNGAFTSVTVCVPATTTCQTIDGVLVDTGSSGLRLLSSALTISLPQQKAGDGNPVVECLPFVSGYTWGPVQTADIQISGEKASAVPIQVMSDTDFPVPGACADRGSSEDTLSALGANGLLGVGNFAQDCGGACVATGAGNPELYYECPASGCVVTGESLAQQVQNPVALFATDNNGVILELPAVTGPEASISGSLIFGIGTQSNNGLSGATVYTVDSDGNFTTSYKSLPYNQSFLDSGSNGLYFLTSSASGIPVCPDAAFFYCPSSTQNLSATNQGANGASGQVSFSVASADNLFNDNPSAFVFVNLGGPNSLPGFDWGLPFFFGRNVYTAIEGMSTPGGNGPYWAY
jgi:Protein of unknown function (DUF3443)